MLSDSVAETINLVVNNAGLFKILGTLLGAGAAVAGAAFAIPSIADRLQPPPQQNSLADFLPFLRLMPDGKTKDLSLSSFKGKKYVVLFFYPFDFTFVCPTEILAFSNHIADFEARGVSVIVTPSQT